MTTRANRKTRLQAIMIGRCQGHDTFAAFQPMGIFRFWRNGKFNILKDVYSPSIFFRSPPPTPLLLPFCAGVQLSRRSHRALIDRKKKKKTRKNRGLWSVYIRSCILDNPLLLKQWTALTVQFEISLVLPTRLQRMIGILEASDIAGQSCIGCAANKITQEIHINLTATWNLPRQFYIFRVNIYS